MIDQLPTLAFPEWLAGLSPIMIKSGRFPLLELLGDSLYYPSSGFDGDPVRYLAGNILSFVYVDYGHDREEFMDVLRNPGFRGYDLLATRSVTEQELVPLGWRPAPPTPDDGDPSRYREWIKSPFCIWSVFSRGEAFPVDHGPRRFSLLYLCADGVAAFQALYVGNSVAPKAVAVIQPGTGFGGNWTDFRDPDKILARSVRENPAGQPEILLYGGIGPREFYHQSCWPDYGNRLCFLAKGGGGRIGVYAAR